MDRRLTARQAIYEKQMEKCLREIYRVLKRKRFCVLIVGEFNRNGKTRDTAAVLSALASRVTQGRFVTDCIVQDEIPDVRRSRRGTKTTRTEKFLVLYKRS